MRACAGPQPGRAYSEATGRARLEQVRVEHWPDHQLLDKALGGFLAGDVIPGDLHARGPPSGLGLQASMAPNQMVGRSAPLAVSGQRVTSIPSAPFELTREEKESAVESQEFWES